MGAIVVAVLATASASQATGTFPDAIAAIGDSITTAWGSGGSPVNVAGDNFAGSWATGTTTAVNSHLLRLRAAGASPAAINLAVAGARVTAGSGVAVQATEVPPGTTYVMIETGSADVCVSSATTPQQMTTVADFTTKIQQTLQTLQTQLPGVKIMIASVPNWYRVWQDFPTKTRPAGTCPLLFSSSATTDTRDAVSQRVIAYNDVLAAACAAVSVCKYDGGAVYGVSFAESDLSSYDFFHLSLSGQAKIAAATWPLSWYAGGSPPSDTAPSNTAPPSVSGTAQQGSTLSLTSGTWNGSPAPTLADQWQRCDGAGANCTDIALATGSSYTLVAADIGTRIRVTETATNSAGTTNASSLPSAVVTAASTSPPPLPTALAAVGDSVTTAWGSGLDTSGANVAGDNLNGAWATGTDPTVNSHRRRIAAYGTAPGAVNLAASGAAVTASDGVAAQAGQVPTGTDYVLIEAGSADLCRSSVTSTGDMTATADFASAIQQTLQTLTTRLPGGRILVASIPNWYRVWQDFPGKIRPANTCPLLFSASATAATRDAVRQRTIDYNNALKAACAAVTACRYDDGAVYNLVFAQSELSSFDFFHPSTAGQARIAAVTWTAGWWGTLAPPTTAEPTNTAMPSVSGTAEVGSTLSLTRGTWSGAPTPAISDQWQRCDSLGANCTDIAGATGISYTPAAGDLGKRIRVQETAENLVGSVTVSSAATAGVSLVPGPLPTAISAIGDSITTAWGSGVDGNGANVAGDNLGASWATGTSAAVNSHLLRLRGLGPSPSALDLAIPGVRVTDPDGVPQQATQVPAGVTYVMVEMGSADICLSSVTSAGDMTPVSTFSSKVGETLQTLTTRLPGVRILLASVPNWYGVWQGFPTQTRPSGTCPLLFSSSATTQTRDALRQRTIDYNNALAAACGAVGACRFDGGAVYDLVFSQADLSTYDLFHPSFAGQAKIAAATWNAGWFADHGSGTGTAPTNAAVPTLSATAQEGSDIRLQHGVWTGSPSPAVTDQWQRCNASGASCVDIDDVNGVTYTLGDSDVGKTIRVVETATNGTGSAAAPSAPSAIILAEPSSPRSIAEENALPGSTGWQPYAATAPVHAIDGYASEVSALPGDTLHFHVSTGPAARYRIELYRLGWYGGKGGRLVGCLPGCGGDKAGVERPIPSPDPATGLAQANWPVTDTFKLSINTVSGYYLVKLVLTTGPSTDKSTNIPVVVRTPASRPAAPILVQASVNTAQAYNPWGGKSLYDFNSTGGVAATQVSFDRPFEIGENPFKYEVNLVRFLERESYDVSYQTDVDTQNDPGELQRHRLVIVNGHGEYWTKEMRDAFEAARDSGHNLMFLGADIADWQIRYADGGRTLVEYRSASADPVTNPALDTINFRNLTPPRPQCDLLGIGYQDGIARVGDAPRDYTVVPGALSDRWFAGTGFKAGDKLTRGVGYEWDALDPACPSPPTDLTVFFHFEGLNHYGVPANADAVRYSDDSGAQVFSSGSLQWIWGLDSYDAEVGSPDPRVQQFMRNAIAELTSAPGGAPVNAVRPTITGVPVVGGMLVAAAGTWTGNPTSLSYRWQRCNVVTSQCADIPAGDSQTYVVSPSDLGSQLRVVETALNGGGSTTATSILTDMVGESLPVSTGLPAVTGVTQRAQTLTATTGTWSGNITRFFGEWRRCNAAGANCTTIPGAETGLYTLTAADVGSTVRFAITAVNSAGSTIAVSNPSALVTQPTTPLQIQVLFTNPSYFLRSVDANGVAYGTSTNPADANAGNRLYRSYDEGRTWSQLYDFPAGAQLRAISVLTTNTLLAHVLLSDDLLHLYRSADGGATWTDVFQMPPNYLTLSPHSIGDDGQNAYLASYNSFADDGAHTNFVWRSSDDGRTWTLVRRTETYRHAHFVQVDPRTGAVYVGYGDPQGQIERSTDHGLTWSVICGDPTYCVAVDMGFDSTGGAFFGSDSPFDPSYIRRIDLATGAVTAIAGLPGPSWSVFDLGGGVMLVGETHEPAGIFDSNDHQVHLFGSADGGRTFTDVYQRDFVDPSTFTRLQVQFKFASAEFPIQVTQAGDGTILARVQSARPVNTAGPTVTGTATVGQQLTAGAGQWTGAATIVSTVQWQRCPASGLCANIPGATAATYTLTSADAGSRLRVKATASNTGGATIAFSAWTGVVQAAPTVSAAQSIAGGQTLSGQVVWTATVAGVPTSSVSKVVFSIDGIAKWTENTTPYRFNGDSGSLDTRTLAAGNHTFTVVATLTSGATATSSVTARVSNAYSVSQSISSGQTLSGPLTWVATVSGTLQTARVVFSIAGTTVQTDTTSPYSLSFDTALIPNGTYSFSVQATSTSGTTATSAVTATVGNIPTNTSAPDVTGFPQLGATISSGKGSWTGSPTSYTYQWQRCDVNGNQCANILGATSSTYRIAAADMDRRLRSTVTAKNAYGSKSAASGPTVLGQPASCGQNQFLARYWQNRSFDGSSFLGRCEATINHEWGADGPGSGIPADNFSARWSGQFDFSRSGTYTFTATVDDGVRLYVDGVLILDKWVDHSRITYTAKRSLSAGSHTIVLEYYERTGSAVIKLDWARTSS